MEAKLEAGTRVRFTVNGLGAIRKDGIRPGRLPAFEDRHFDAGETGTVVDEVPSVEGWAYVEPDVDSSVVVPVHPQMVERVEGGDGK